MSDRMEWVFWGLLLLAFGLFVTGRFMDVKQKHSECTEWARAAKTAQDTLTVLRINEHCAHVIQPPAA